MNENGFKFSSKLFIVLIVVATMFAGCSGGQNSTTTSDSSQNPSSQNEGSKKVDQEKPKNEGEIKAVNVLLAAGVSGEEAYYQEQAKIFMEKNPDIELKITFVPGDQYGNTVSLMFASNEAPDIIRMSGSFPTKMSISYEKEWIQPLDQFVTDEFKKQFPESFFGENSGLYIDEKLYSIPYVEQKVPAMRPFYYNKDILKEHGFESPPKTWSELKDMAATITKEGKGKVYGFSLNGKDKPFVPVNALYETANDRYKDAHVTEGNIIYDTKTGKSALYNPALESAIQLINEMKRANTFMPGWESTDEKMMFTQFAAGKIAMIIGQTWYPKDILQLNPDINLGISSAPVPDSGRKGYKALYAAADPYFGITSKSKYPDAAWKVIEFFSLPEFHEGWYNITKIPTVLWRNYQVEDYTKKLMETADEILRIAPYPGFQHKDGENLLSAVFTNAPKPDFKDIVIMTTVGDKDYKALATEFDQKLNQVMDEQIQKLRDEGSDITGDVFIAPSNWDPMEDYSNK